MRRIEKFAKYIRIKGIESGGENGKKEKATQKN
jgi:hypothetical protein